MLEITSPSQGQINIKGDLTFATINQKTVQRFDFKKNSFESAINVDLNEVGLSDSAGLALMIEWVKLAHLHEVKLTFQNIPQQLLNLAKLSGFENNAYLAQTVTII